MIETFKPFENNIGRVHMEDTVNCDATKGT